MDDHPAVALALRVAFRLDGRFEIAATATTGADGLRNLDGQDAVLLDLHLPDLQGPELVREFRGPFPHIPLLPSGGVTAETAPEFIRAGAIAVGLGSWLIGDGHPAGVESRALTIARAVSASREPR